MRIQDTVRDQMIMLVAETDELKRQWEAAANRSSDGVVPDLEQSRFEEEHWRLGQQAIDLVRSAVQCGL